MKNKVLSVVLKYGCCFAFMGVFTFGILSSVGFSSSDPMTVRYLDLADAFTVPAIIVLSIGVLVWVSTTGFFDSISYAVVIGLRTLIPFMRHGQTEKYYDYKTRKEGKRIKGHGFLIISGAIYLIPAIVFSILFYIA